MRTHTIYLDEFQQLLRFPMALRYHYLLDFLLSPDSALIGLQLAITSNQKFFPFFSHDNPNERVPVTFRERVYAINLL